MYTSKTTVLREDSYQSVFLQNKHQRKPVPANCQTWGYKPCIFIRLARHTISPIDLAMEIHSFSCTMPFVHFKRVP